MEYIPKYDLTRIRGHLSLYHEFMDTRSRLSIFEKIAFYESQARQKRNQLRDLYLRMTKVRQKVLRCLVSFARLKSQTLADSINIQWYESSRLICFEGS